MAEVLRCEHCASRDLTRVSDGEYLCNHCKSRILLAKPATPNPALPSGTAQAQPGRRPPTTTSPGSSAGAKPQTALQKAGTVVFVLVCLGAVVALKMHRAEQRSDRARRQAIQRSVAASLSGTFRPSRSAGSDAEADKPQAPQQFGDVAIEAEKSLTATFSELTPLPDSIGNIYFVGIYKNTGEATIERPQVEIALLDKQGKKLSVAHGYGAPTALLPGEEVPVKILVQQPPRYETAKYTITPERARYGGRSRFKLTVAGAKLAAAQFGGYDLTGTVRNDDREPVQFVQLTMLLRDDKSAIVGLDGGFTGQKVLQPGEESPFRIHASQVHGKPSRFAIYTNALAVRN